ncbi:enolase C-terminal domain-like protein [Nonomuraea sp. SYSU D8015]|uniref:enolase C-terminal domain-like protein n=1 Tax=Nonomuraea sp. SYSU D8015 TaxID=2593644 RepID=UPI001660BB22|nr:enolase C-terminal domain-like protein [Nonomuraea sp. SYSU D8015]
MRAVSEINAAVYTIPTDQPETDGTLTWDHTTMVLVEARAEDETGIGWTYGPAACASVVHDQLAPLVRGMSAFDVPAAFTTMVREIRNAGRPGVAGYAISAVETALWDLKARLLGLPLCGLLGQALPHVPVYGSGGFVNYTIPQLHEQVSQWVHEEGIPRVKIKIGGADDITRVRQARDAMGPLAGLYVDANGAYTAKQAIRIAEVLEGSDVSWFEEPVSSDDLAGLRQVRDATQIDVTAGEYGYDLFYFRRMAEAVDCLQIDVTRCGGILEWQRATAIAAAHNLEVSAHCAPQLHLHAALATPNLRHVEWFHDHVRIESLFFDGFRTPVEGMLEPDLTRPGIGLELRTPDVEKYRIL